MSLSTLADGKWETGRRSGNGEVRSPSFYFLVTDGKVRHAVLQVLNKELVIRDTESDAKPP